MIEVKTPSEIEVMRRAGRVVAGLLTELSALVRAGLKTKALDEASREYLKRRGAQPAFLGYRGFPATICVSLNEEVVHGIPSQDRRLQEGDIIGLDLGAIVEGYYADAAITVPVGSVPEGARRLMETTRQALDDGIRRAVVGNRLHDISHAVQQRVERAGLGVVRDFVGHGI